ncbi:hypothetical protein [Streptomyces sp. SID12488]|uniref:hypothetical protein n=1 Tax=Streptomyces sp. SID12488 TaxID=2706040 RepID=UPI0013DA2D93|nr:hypothetical protein [Streptomyces sp. SID12488]NEA67465.1 hypothetical protein [Streptomyces sp. SID12488]
MNNLMSAGIHDAPRQSENAHVLAGRPLRPGSRLEDTARFSDDVWRLAPAIVQVQERTVVLNFPTIPARFRPATKRLFYALLCPELESPPGEDRPAIASVRTAFGEMKRLLTWLDAQWPADRIELSAISPADLDRYNRHLLTLFPHRDGTREAARAALRLLWRWRIHLGNDQLRFDPLDLDGWSEKRTQRGRENGTDRLPEGVLGPLLVWALRFIDDFAGQVALDRHRPKRIMKRHDPAIYPGEYITCVNDPAKALCEKARRGNGEGLPSHGGCLPLACRKVTLTPQNITAWQSEIVRIDGRVASRPTLPPRLRQLLESRRAEIVEFLTANGQEAVPA